MNCNKPQRGIQPPTETGANKVCGEFQQARRGTRVGIVTARGSDFQWAATPHVGKNCSGRQGVMRAGIAKVGEGRTSIPSGGNSRVSVNPVVNQIGFYRDVLAKPVSKSLDAELVAVQVSV